jgi:hypothetical protein
VTCIVGFTDGNEVSIGGDSAGVGGWDLTVRADEKVFVLGEFVFGCTTSFRMGQLLRYKLTSQEGGISPFVATGPSGAFLTRVKASL